ncbi:nuclear transport factor 2 family protein [Chryseobacterium gleum]|uniref:nuclear transport factor 2 family protein n=1 Tax=Chryseobacterium gleum TaxID=250 RepID=UPI0028B027A1|nr:nuclear transport factor 2 family protein [Chryseobacterium gleum]
MNLPNVIAKLIKAQNNFDSASYAQCFTETAIVFDEGKTHKGKTEIEKWIDKSNKEYKATMEPLDYNDRENILSAEISGSFPGSPIILKFHFEITDEKIQQLKVTD